LKYNYTEALLFNKNQEIDYMEKLKVKHGITNNKSTLPNNYKGFPLILLTRNLSSITHCYAMIP